MEPFDVIVIGGGSAGIMAAIGAARAGADVLLLEKRHCLGQKLLISGGGRCNVTNAKGIDHIIENTPGNGRFLYSAFAKWSNEDIIAFFTELGVPLKEEDRGRMFPVTDKAATVVNALVRHLGELGVTTRFGADVKRLDIQDKTCRGVHLQDGSFIRARSVVIAPGGCSAPKTGSTGDGYAWARAAGHDIVAPYPTSVPLTANDSWIADRSLQGVSLREIVQILYDPRGKVVTRQEGDMIFTHFGLSGPVSLRTSQYVVKTLTRFAVSDVLLTIDLLPAWEHKALLEGVGDSLRDHPKRSIRSVMREWLPERLAAVVIASAKIDDVSECANVSKRHLEHLTTLMKAWPVHVTGTLGIERATVTGGGVDVKGVDPATMASKLVRGVYFAGEVMDVHAHTGGYNITVAFSTGHVAGTSAADYSRMGV